MHNLIKNIAAKHLANKEGKQKALKSRPQMKVSSRHSEKKQKQIPIADHGFVQHSFNRNPGSLLPTSSLFCADCV